MTHPSPRAVAAARRAVARAVRRLALPLVVPGAALAQPLAFQVQVADDPANDVGKHAALALHPRNFIVHLVYYDATAADLRYAVNEGAGWMRQTIDSDGDVGQYASIVVDRNGVVHVSYYDATNTALKYARKEGAGSWITRTVASTGDVGVHTSIDLNAIRQPVITYYDQQSQDLFLAHSPSATYSTWSTTLCCEAVPIGRAPLSMRGAEYRVLYFEGASRALKTRVFDANAPASTAWGHAETITNGVAIEDLSLAERGQLYVSYTDADAESPSSLYWVRHDGSTWRPPERIASGSHGSIAVDSTGQPFIAFYVTSSTPAAELRYAYRRDDAWQIQTIDAPGANVGTFASLDFDLCDDPHVAYYDDTNNRLKYATALAPGGCHEHLVDNGDGTVTDTATGLMWLEDANHLATSDPAQNGTMPWSGAVAWANGLTYAGRDDWRLPATAEPDPTCDSQEVFTTSTARVVKGCARSELGHLRWVDGVHPRTPGPFVNLQGRGTYYWSGTTWSRADPPGSRAWAHSFFHGEQGPAMVSPNPHAYGWAVREVREGGVAAATGSGTVAVTTSAGRLVGLTAVDEASLPSAGKPAGVSFPHGFLGWRITNVETGATVTVTITYPAPVAAVSYWKVIGGAWTDVTSLVGSNDGDATITLTITDGGLGDADGAANGTIVDPGGIGRLVYRLSPWLALLLGLTAVVIIVGIIRVARGTRRT